MRTRTTNHPTPHRSSTRHRTMGSAAVLGLALTASLAACGDNAGESADERTAVEPAAEQDAAATVESTTDDVVETTADVAETTAETTTEVTTADDTASAETTDEDAAAEAPATDDTALALPESDELDPEEVTGLLWMREEEQMAHDVYVALGEEYGLRVFENIARSEQQHIDMTIDLLDRYDLPDVAAGNEPGTFTDPQMQELYDDLIAQGMQSKADALIVGATIEELDIADLRARAAITDEPEIDDVYARLEQASGNHLRAFVGQLELLDVEYEPTVLDDVDEILATPMQRGRRGDH